MLLFLAPDQRVCVSYRASPVWGHRHLHGLGAPRSTGLRHPPLLLLLLVALDLRGRHLLLDLQARRLQGQHLCEDTHTHTHTGAMLTSPHDRVQTTCAPSPAHPAVTTLLLLLLHHPPPSSFLYSLAVFSSSPPLLPSISSSPTMHLLGEGAAAGSSSSATCLHQLIRWC